MLFMKMLKKSLLIQRPSGSQTDVQPERQNTLTDKQTFRKTDTKTGMKHVRPTILIYYPLSHISGIRNRPKQQAACQISSTASQLDRLLTAASAETD